jgi:tetratricopeptide (TPR) repeat protein
LYGWQARQRLGVALLRSGEPEAALPHLEEAVRQAPYDAVGHQDLAAALIALGRHGRALAELQDAAEIAPHDARIRLDLGQTLLRFGFYEEAWPELTAADSLCHGCSQAARALARYHLETGSPGEAAAFLQRVMADEPDRNTRLILAGALLDAGRPEETVQLLQDTPLEESSAAECRLLIRADRMLGRTDRAVRWASFAGTDQVFPPEIVADALFWAVVAELCHEADQPLAALQAIDTALAVAPDNAVYLVNRAAFLQDLGREEEAARELERARAVDPEIAPQNR